MPAKDGGPTEKEWQRVVVGALETLGWKVTHTYPGEGDQHG